MRFYKERSIFEDLRFEARDFEMDSNYKCRVSFTMTGTHSRQALLGFQPAAWGPGESTHEVAGKANSVTVFLSDDCRPWSMARLPTRPTVGAAGAMVLRASDNRGHQC